MSFTYRLSVSITFVSYLKRHGCWYSVNAPASKLVNGLYCRVHVCVCVFLCVFMCRRRLTEQQGLPGRANQSVGGPERSVLPAEHGAEGRRAAGAQSRPLLHLRPDILQTALHGGGRRGGEGGGRSTACPVYLQEGEARNNIDSQYQLI